MKLPHHRFTSTSVGPLNSRDFHGVYEHPSKAERNFFWVFFASHRYFEAVAEVDVKNLSAHAIEEQIGRVPVAQAEDVAHHRHDCQGTSEVGPPVEPHLTRRRLEKKKLGKIIPLIIKSKRHQVLLR